MFQEDKAAQNHPREEDDYQERLLGNAAIRGVFAQNTTQSFAINPTFCQPWISHKGVVFLLGC